MIGRIVTGLGVGALSAAVPVYQAETVPRQLRGTLIATYQLMITFGILMAYCFCLGTRELDNAASWRIPIALGIVFAVFLGVGILFMPESPRWLMKRNKHDLALASIAKVHASPNDDPWVQVEYKEILVDTEKEKQVGGGSWLECFVGYPGGHKTVYRTFLGMILQMFQQLTGAWRSRRGVEPGGLLTRAVWVANFSAILDRCKLREWSLWLSV
jgi:SP family sugar:H+ symporter-like MFS transporter